MSNNFSKEDLTFIITPLVDNSYGVGKVIAWHIENESNTYQTTGPNLNQLKALIKSRYFEAVFVTDDGESI